MEPVTLATLHEFLRRLGEHFGGLPERDKEKQMLQGLLGSKERVVTDVQQGRLL
jgi:hypothetical protein